MDDTAWMCLMGWGVPPIRVDDLLTRVDWMNPADSLTPLSQSKERPMTEQKNQLASLFAACWKDEALKARFMADPKAVLAEYDMDVPDGMDVKVVENADNCVHITMPAPPSGSVELSDEELSDAAGGFFLDVGGTAWQPTP